MTAFHGATNHDAPGARQHGLAHLDRLAVQGAIWEPAPARPRRCPAVRLLRLVWHASLTAIVLAVLYGALVVT